MDWRRPIDRKGDDTYLKSLMVVGNLNRRSRSPPADLSRRHSAVQGTLETPRLHHGLLSSNQQLVEELRLRALKAFTHTAMTWLMIIIVIQNDGLYFDVQIEARRFLYDRLLYEYKWITERIFQRIVSEWMDFRLIRSTTRALSTTNCNIPLCVLFSLAETEKMEPQIWPHRRAKPDKGTYFNYTNVW